MSRKRILITGMSGLIGSVVRQALSLDSACREHSIRTQVRSLWSYCRWLGLGGRCGWFRAEPCQSLVQPVGFGNNVCGGRSNE